MKAKLFMTILLMCGGIGSSLVLANENVKDNPQPIEIIIKGNPQTQPRHLIIKPIECYYYKGVLYFTFNNDWGDVEVLVSSEINAWMETIDTSDGMGEISIINGGAGSYSVEIVTEYGECFVGSFRL